MNGDGIPDLLMSTPNFMNGQTTKARPIFFPELNSARAERPAMPSGPSKAIFPMREFGFSIAAGDINHDGYSDVVVGAPYHPNSGVPPGMPQVLGQVFVYFGSPAGLSTTADQVLTPNVLIGGTHWFGYSLSIVGDVNGDGYADVIIGAPAFTHSQANEGAIYLYYGSSTGLVVNTALVFEGNVAGAQYGYAVAGAGDVDGDGYADVLVGAPFYGSGEFTVEEGYASVLRGSIEGISVTFWGIYGGYAGAHLGSDLAGVGDINGDGLADFAVAAPDELNSDGLRGRVSLFLGAPGPGTGIASETWRAWGVSGIARPPGLPHAGDINGDSFDDTLAFDPAGNGGDPFARVQLILGRGQRALDVADAEYFEATDEEPLLFRTSLTRDFRWTCWHRARPTAKTRGDARRRPNLYLTTQQAGGNPENILPAIRQLKLVVPPELYDLHLGDINLQPGTAFYIDCGATNEYQDALGRWWVPDAPSSSSAIHLSPCFHHPNHR